jgi:arginase
VAAVATEALQAVSGGVAGIHVSPDRTCDPRLRPGLGTGEGGLNYREAHLLMELIAESGSSRSTCRGEPDVDIRNTTAELGTELALGPGHENPVTGD